MYMICDYYHNHFYVYSVVYSIYGYMYVIPVPEYPNCLHATLAADVPQLSSHTVPHTPPIHSSTLPSVDIEPSINRIDPSVQAETKNNKTIILYTIHHLIGLLDSLLLPILRESTQ